MQQILGFDFVKVKRGKMISIAVWLLFLLFLGNFESVSFIWSLGKPPPRGSHLEAVFHYVGLSFKQRQRIITASEKHGGNIQRWGASAFCSSRTDFLMLAFVLLDQQSVCKKSPTGVPALLCLPLLKTPPHHKLNCTNSLNNKNGLNPINHPYKAKWWVELLGSGPHPIVSPPSWF